MTDIQKVWVGVFAVGIIAIIGCFTPQGKALIGSIDGPTTYSILGTTQIKVGSGCGSGFKYNTCGATALTALNFGSCTIWTSATTIAATSTQQIVCQANTDGSIGALSNITASSNCDLIMASSTNTTLGGLVVEGVSASSTAGTLVARLANFTGATFSWTSTASSSSQWEYQCFN